MAKFLGMGNPLLDISAEVGQDVLDKYGVQINNAIMAEEKHLPVFPELQAMEGVSYIAGGATQNSVRVAQWMMQEKGATAYVGCVGKDDYAKQLKTCAEADGVAVHYLEDDAPTGTCAVLVSGGDRSLIANLSAANNYKVAHYETADIQKVVGDATHIYSAGFFFTVSPETIMKVGQHCADNNKVYCLNISAPFIAQFFSEPLLAAIPLADIVFGNESEAEAFGEKMGYDDKSVEAVAVKIAQMDKTNTKRDRLCIITQGSLHTVVANKEGIITKYPVPKLAKEEIKDVNGAGDSFVGGFMAALIQGKSEKECVNAGHYAASCILKVSGCAVPTTAPQM